MELKLNDEVKSFCYLVFFFVLVIIDFNKLMEILVSYVGNLDICFI